MYYYEKLHSRCYRKMSFYYELRYENRDIYHRYIKIICIIYASSVKSHRIPRVFLFLSKRILFVSSDFGRTCRTSFVEIVKVSRDTMNYSYHGDAKLRETFLWRGESLLVYVYVCVCIREACGVLVCRCRRSRRGKKGQIAE